MSESKQYPAWQAAFRVAQAERDQRVAEMDAKKREEAAEVEAAKGVELTKALMHFGIFIEPAPFTNHVEVDGFAFRLDQNGYRAFKNKSGESNWEQFQFNLIVEKRIPGRTDDDDDPSRYRHVTVNTSSQPRNAGWDHYLVRLADAFDEIDQAVAFDVARDASRKAERELLGAVEERESDQEKLLKLLRSIIRDEIADQLYS